MTNPATPSTTAIFLWQGFIGRQLLTDEEGEYYGGHFGAALDIARWVARIDACQPLLELLQYPGVFEYDVVVHLGAMLRRRRCVVSIDTIALACAGADVWSRSTPLRWRPLQFRVGSIRRTALNRLLCTRLADTP
jgi:hypothetical protein